MRNLLSLLITACIPFFLALGQTPLPNPNLAISCPYDIIFVLDESGSIVGQGTGTSNINDDYTTMIVKFN